MQTAVFGGTGRVGRELVSLMNQNGHALKLLVRSPEKLPGLLDAAVLKGNVRNQTDTEDAIKGCSSIISCLNTDGDDSLSVGMRHIIQAAEKWDVQRIVTVGTAGILQARSNPALFRFQSDESKRRLTRAAEEHAKVFGMLRNSGLKWTIVCPTYLPDGQLTKTYRTEADFLPEGGTSISVQDTAHFVYEEWKKENFLFKRAGIAY
ncbi:NAD(P)H-binding protein [Bacillus mangrovi]|uniref:NAD(P)H-binding protein n=2 Tax=Metabacillus mangrovi TaxID=1491830 RepID=A0A7X2S7C0_9BACI|nr:NAD(P)H-binding protein [Metabacillus mangrovi]